MAITKIQHLEAVGGTTLLSVTIPGCSAGNGILILVRWNNTVTLDSITCSGETVNIHTNPVMNVLGTKHAYAEIISLAGGGSKEITANFGASVGGAAAILAVEVSGLHASPFDTDTSTSGSTTNPAPSITTTANNAFILSGIESQSGDATAGAGYTQLTLGDIFNYGQGEFDADAGTAGGVTVPWTISGSWGISAAAWKPASGGGGGGLNAGAESSYAPGGMQPQTNPMTVSKW